MSRNAALIVAAGRGRRIGGEIPKQYLALGGQPVLRRAVAALAGHPEIAAAAVVINFEDLPLYEKATQGLDLLPPVEGGARRQDSVRLGLESLCAAAPERVLIHDGARPFADAATVSRIVEALATVPGAIAALPLTDTLKRGAMSGDTGAVVAATVARANLWRAQTPQGFRFRDILEAHRAAAAGPELTDDAAVAEKAGLQVALVVGSEDNFKVTTREDLARGEKLLMGRLGDVRVGSGLDAHAFAGGDHVMICGVKIAHDQGLGGHSDADVGLHALTDAILGALGAGDIGQHFPSADDRWKNAASEHFLRHAGALVAEAGALINHLDVTVICEKPKLAPFRDAMATRISEILDLDRGRVSVKATTTDKLGFTGRGEGIAAQATATISLPATLSG